MSWWWRQKPEKSPDSLASSSETEHVQVPNSGVALIEEVKQPLSREEQATQDFEQLLKELENDFDVRREERDSARAAGKTTNPLPTDISPDSLYPTEMSCRSAFDYAMFCQNFGGQFVNVYRYGTFRSCSSHWSDFWLCMRARNYTEKERKQAIQNHYKQKAIKWKMGPSSEDVWEVRTEPVKDPFQDSLEELEAKIAAWKRANPDVPDPWDKSQGATFKS